MPFLELFAIIMAASTLGHLWHGKCIVVQTDCIPAMSMVNKRYSSNPFSNALIRSLAHTAIVNGFDIRATYLPGIMQVRADPLSRNDLLAFFEQAPLANALQSTHRWPQHLFWPEQQSC
jgi:hypothetical protein